MVGGNNFNYSSDIQPVIKVTNGGIIPWYMFLICSFETDRCSIG